MTLKEEKENDNDGGDDPEAGSADVEYPAPEQHSEETDHREEGTLADELESRIDSALSGDVASADSIEDAFLSE